MTSELRVGVSGSGFMGRTHVDAAHKLDQVRPVAVTGGSRAAQLAEDYGLEEEPSVAAMVARGDLDAIVITTPHWLHCDEALLAAEAGLHALVEKPLATTVEDCRRMTNAFAERQLVLSVGYHQRFRESNTCARDAIQSGRIGPVRCIQMSALFDIEAMRQSGGFGGKWSWWTDPRAIAHLINSGPHNVDLCRWWLNSEIVSVSAQCGTFREENPNENTTMALLRFQDGAMASFWSSSVVPHPGFAGEEFRFRIMGDSGVIDLNPYGQVLLGQRGETEVLYEQAPVGHDSVNSAFAMNRMQAYCDQLAAFASSIAGTRGGEGNAADGEAGVAAVLAMLESDARQAVIQLS